MGSSSEHNEPDVRVRASAEGGVGPGELARLVRRRLELLRLFGFEVPLRVGLRPGAPLPAAPRSAPTSVVGPAGGRVASGTESRSHVVESPAVACPSDSNPIAGTSDSNELHRREVLLAPLRREVRDCQRCRLCQLGRTQTVFGVGSPCARLFLVGEGPGFDEDRVGEPFVGRAGQLLDKILSAMGLRREEVYIGNVVKCRPPRNRTPDPMEVAACLPYLEQQIEVIRPQVLCLLGATAARALLRTTSSVGKLRGRFHEYRGIPVRVTYHPAYLLRNPSDKRKTWDDVQAIMKHLAGTPSDGL